VSFAAITLCVASQRVFIVYFVIDSVRELLDIPSYRYGDRIKEDEIGRACSSCGINEKFNSFGRKTWR
jgi:hypothetical protein